MDDFKVYEACLGPCPFCGGVDQFVTGMFLDTMDPKWHVSCIQCHAETGNKRTEKEAIYAWQRRKEKKDEEDSYYLWCAHRERFVRELGARGVGTDRSDAIGGKDSTGGKES